MRLPRVPQRLVEEPGQMEPAPEMADWATQLIAPDSPLSNPDHRHLELADLGFLWVSEPYRRRGRQVLGTAELGGPPPSIFGWRRTRLEVQVMEWFGQVPDFLITLYAPFVAQASDVEVCALVEHELYHCAEATDEFGLPKFTKSGRPTWSIRGHDVEEFVGVIQRYGAVRPEIAELGRAALSKPSIGAALARAACGTCLRAA